MARRIIIIGDLMVDEYIWGDVNYISPEAPVPVVEEQRTEYRLGGACNVASNVKSLEGHPVLIGRIGIDNTAEIMKALLERQHIEFKPVASYKPTTRKVRVMGNSHQLLRIDYETTDPCDYDEDKGLRLAWETAYNNSMKAPVVVVSDYAKGVISAELLELLTASPVYVIVDPAPDKYTDVEIYKWCDVITPNFSEALELLKMDRDDRMTPMDQAKFAASKLTEILECNVIITMGEDGMLVHTTDFDTTVWNTQARSVYDVTGAGDTVVAAIATEIARGKTLHDAAMFANAAAGIVVGKLGTSTVTRREIKIKAEKGEDYKC